MRIAVVEPTSKGGLLHYAFQLADALAERGNAVDLIVPAGNELAEHRGAARRLAILGAPTPPTDGALARLPLLRRARVAVRLLHAWATINWQARRGGYDALILTSDVDLWPVAAAVNLLTVAPRGTGIAAIGHSARPFNRWSGSELFVSSPLLDRLLRLFYRRLDALFVHGERSRAEFEQTWHPRRLVVIPHGDERLFGDPPPAAQEQRLLFFGDWRKVKGLPILMEAFDELVTTSPEARITIAGTPCSDDLDPDQIRSWAAGHGEHVTVVDRYVPVEDVAELFGSARAVVTPYLVAYQSGVVHLAMTMARAVVASDVGDLPSVVIDGETGITVNAGDPHALAGALARVLEDPELAERLGREGHRRLLAGSSWDKVAEIVEGALARGNGG
jgi:glycosyltransferase involved in cell wall biosynthesis